MDIFKLVNSLSKDECSVIYTLYKIENKLETKAYEAFKLIRETQAIELSELSIKLYGKQKAGSKLSHCISKLRKDIYRIIRLKINGSKYVETSVHEARFAILNNLLSSITLNERGFYLESNKMIANLPKLASKFELHEEALYIYQFQLSYCGMSLSKKELEHLQKRIKLHSSNCIETVNIEYFVKYVNVLNNEFIGSSADLQQSISEYLDVKCDSTIEYTERAKIALNKLRIIYYYLCADFELLMKSIFDLEKLMRDVRHSNSDVGGLLTLRANAHMCLGEYGKSLKFYIEAHTYFLKSGINDLNLKKQLIHLYFRSNNFSKAIYFLEEIVDQYVVNKNEEFLFQYYDAIICYYLGNTKKALKSLDCINLVPENKRFIIQMKISQIILLIELNQYDIVQKRIESLRKYVYNYGFSEEPRIFLIVSILKRIYYDGLSFLKVTERVSQDSFNLLSKWNPLGYELIRFDTWFQEKLQQELEAESKRRIGRYRRVKRLNTGGSRVSEE